MLYINLQIAAIQPQEMQQVNIESKTSLLRLLPVRSKIWITSCLDHKWIINVKAEGLTQINKNIKMEEMEIVLRKGLSKELKEKFVTSSKLCVCVRY